MAPLQRPISLNYRRKAQVSATLKRDRTIQGKRCLPGLLPEGCRNSRVLAELPVACQRMLSGLQPAKPIRTASLQDAGSPCLWKARPRAVEVVQDVEPLIRLRNRAIRDTPRQVSEPVAWSPVAVLQGSARAWPWAERRAGHALRDRMVAFAAERGPRYLRNHCAVSAACSVTSGFGVALPRPLAAGGGHIQPRRRAAATAGGSTRGVQATKHPTRARVAPRRGTVLLTGFIDIESLIRERPYANAVPLPPLRLDSETNE